MDEKKYHTLLVRSFVDDAPIRISEMISLGLVERNGNGYQLSEYGVELLIEQEKKLSGNQ